jgi:alpha-tubulin suppressor-like RCC1 family protein
MRNLRLWRPVMRHGDFRRAAMVRWPAAGAVLTLLAGVLVAAQVVFPMAASATSSHAITIGAGYDASSCAIRGGKAYCWGANASGELGNDSTISSDVPVPVYTGVALSGLTLTQIAVGSDFACALSSAGTFNVYCWGAGASGQLGNGSTTATQDTPVQVSQGLMPANTTLTQVDAGASFAYVLSSLGAAYCWGQGGNGNLGNGSTPTTQDTPVAVSQGSIPSGKTLTEITTGTDFACAVASNSAAYCWGKNSDGQLGDGNFTTPVDTPTAVSTSGVLSGVTVTQIDGSLAGTTACALSSVGAVYCLGRRRQRPARQRPHHRHPGHAGGGDHDRDPAVRSDRDPAHRREGSGVRAGQHRRRLLLGRRHRRRPGKQLDHRQRCAGGRDHLGSAVRGETLTQISAGGSFTCAQDSTGILYCWGLNSSGEAGNPDTGINSLVPETVAPSITESNESTCTIYGGKAYCWGDDTYGEVGSNNYTSSLSPVAVYTGIVLSGVTLTQISSTYEHTCALSTAGTAYCWGENGDGQLGDGNDTTINAPAAVTTGGSSAIPSGTVLTQISTGQYSTCALSSAGNVYCWGLETSGQLGNGSNTGSSDLPVAVTTGGSSAIPSGTVLAQIAVGWLHACALASTGTAYCWGLDGNGELGNHGNPADSAPVEVCSTTPGASACGGSYLSGVTQISAGQYDTCALNSSGTAYCWGYNADGRLGLNNTSNVNYPYAVYTVGALSGITLTQISAGAVGTCALDTRGIAYCWGFNGNGEVGNDSISEENAAVVVGPQAPTSVTGIAGNTTAAMSWTAPVYLNNGTLTSYTATASPGSKTCTSSSATSCTITGLTDGITYTITVTTTASTGTSAPSISASVDPIGLDMTTPTSLTWSSTETGIGQSIVDGISGDQQITVGDSSGTTGWHITLTATTLTTGTHTLPNTSAMDFTGSTSSIASTAPSTACVGSCTLPTNTTTYPVAITTAASSPGTYTIYDTSASTGVGVVTIGGSSATNPIGWWINVPASAYAGSFTSTVTLELVSGP